MRLGNFNFVDVDPWKWRASYTETIGAEKDRFELYVVDPMSHRVDLREIRFHPEFHGMKFDTLAELVDFLISQGMVREEEAEDDYRSGPWIKTMTDENDEEGYRKYLNYARNLDIALANFKSQ